MTDLQSTEVKQLVPALLKAQAEFQPAVKNAVNPAFKSKYVTLDAALDAVAAPLHKHDIWFTQQTDIDEAGNLTLFTKLIHTSGEWVGCRYRVTAVQPTPQGLGSALTFARRYSLMSLLGIAPEDDDGNAASRSQRDDGEQRVAYDSMQPLKDAIDHADTVPALEALFDKCANAKLTHGDAVELKGYYDARMAELQGVLV